MQTGGKMTEIYEIGTQLRDLLINLIQSNKHSIILEPSSKFRVVGYENGELFLGLRCKYIQLEKPEIVKNDNLSLT